MNRSYWEKIAPSYNEEIFDVLHNDKKAIIRKEIQRHAAASKTVIDIGCAVGKWLPVLSPAFKKVTAVDISAKNLSIAKKNYPAFTNVTYQRLDMSSTQPNLPQYDFAICINAILTDSSKKRTTFLKNTHACLRKNSYLLLTVPSLESWMLTRTVQHQWQIDKKLFAGKLSTAEGARRYSYLQQGNVEIDNVQTKHFLGEELDLVLSQHGFVVEKRKKIEYDWSTEFVNPPAWLKKPGPWDWMVLAKKIN